MTNELDHGVSEQELRLQFERILTAPSFQRGHRLTEFLRFIAKKFLSKRFEDLTETGIAQDFFEKSAAFNSERDTLVRTTASRVRDAMRAYYRSQGRRDLIVISLPPKGYVPVVRLRGSSDRRSKQQPPPASLEVRMLCKEGSLNLERRSGDSLWDALKHFEDAASLAPTHAEAYCGIADSCVLLNVVGEMSGLEGKRRAEAALVGLSAEQRKSAKVLASSACVDGLLGWRWSKAERGFRNALRLKASAKIHFDFASFCLLPSGKLEEAAEQLQKALELAENSPRIMLHQAIVLYAQRRFAEAVYRCQSAMKMHAGFGGFQFWLGRIYTALGEYDKAAEYFEAAWKLVPLLDVKSHWAYCLGRMGRTEQAEALVSELEQFRTSRYLPPHGLALAHLGLGRVESAIDWLERGLDERDVWLPLLVNLDPWLDEIRLHARLQRLRQFLGPM